MIVVGGNWGEPGRLSITSGSYGGLIAALCRQNVVPAAETFEVAFATNTNIINQISPWLWQIAIPDHLALVSQQNHGIAFSVLRVLKLLMLFSGGSSDLLVPTGMRRTYSSMGCKGKYRPSP